MTLNQIRFAAAVAQTGSFTVAATECSVTQPSLSNAVAQLEDELGQKLFVRTTRKVGLTAFGKQLLPDLIRVLDAQKEVEDKAKAYLSPPRPLIRIGTSPLLDASCMKIFIQPFRANHQSLKIVLREMNMAELDRQLEAEQLDFIVGVAGLKNDTREKAFLYEEPLLYVPRAGASASPRRTGGTVRLADIADETFLMLPDSCGLALTTRNLFRSHRKPLREYAGEAMSYQVLEQWASLGIGSAILPESKVIDDHSETARILDKKGKEVIIRFDAMWKKETEKIKHLREFADYLRKVVPAISMGMADRHKK